MSSDQEFIRNICIESYSQGQKTNGKYTLIKQNMLPSGCRMGPALLLTQAQRESRVQASSSLMLLTVLSESFVITEMTR